MNNEIYAPVDFADADDERPLNAFYDISLTQTVNNIVSRHVHEVRQKTPGHAMPSTQWRRRLREFLSSRTNDLLDFLGKPLAKHPNLGPAELLLRKFSLENFNVMHPSLREVALDMSGVDIHHAVEQGLKQFEPHTLKGFNDSGRYLFEMFREAGAEIMLQDTRLQSKLEMYDKVHARVIILSELDQSEHYDALAEATQAYLKDVFDKYQIEDTYKGLIDAYRRFIVLKDIISFRRFSEVSLAEPLCNICFEEQISYVITPCGHTYCGTCIKKQISQCYICRGNVKDRVRLFFG
jgi:hypothetical protein